MKKLLSVLIILSMLLSLVPAYAEETATDENYSKVVAKLSDHAVISKSGMKASTEQTKSGNFTALIEGNLLSKSFTVSPAITDFSKGTYIEMAVYSPKATSTAVGLLLMADNPSTATKDYYFAILSCTHEGWKNFSYLLDTLRVNGTPKPLTSIDSIQLVPGYGGSAVDQYAKLHFDDIYIRSKQSADANVDPERPERKPLVVWSAETHGTGEVIEIEGQMGMKWGPGEEVLKNTRTDSITPKEDWHIEKYEELVIEMYSPKATGHIMCMMLYGDDNPETSGADFYWSKFPINWEGRWNEIRIPMHGGNNNMGGFSKSRKPQFLPTGTTRFYLNGMDIHEGVFVPDTEVYLGKIYFAGDAEKTTIENPTGDLIYPDKYDPSTMTDYVAMVKEKHPNKHHPRLLVSDEILGRIKKYKDTDPFMKKAYNSVKKQADAYLTEPPPSPTYKYVTGEIGVERNHLEDLTEACGLMYLLTDDKAEKAKYAERIWLDVTSIIDCDTDWVKSSKGTGLDSGHNANGVALAYDWCYDYWTKEQKQYMRNGVMKYALYNAARIGNGGGYLTGGNNVVPSITKGYMTAVLAFCDEPGYENYCNEYINNIVKYMGTAFMYQYEPDGMYAEGLSYWWYSVTTYAYMLTAMQTAIGTDAGLGDFEGYSKTAYMPIAVRGPQGAFDFSDSTKNSMQYGTPVYFYLDERYNIPAARSLRMSSYEKAGLEAIDLIWYNPERPTDYDWRGSVQKDYFMGGLEPIVSMRSSYETDGYFIAGKGGNSKTGHDQYDAGSFVIDALGVRWIEETGSDVYDYDTPSYYRYRERPEGNNCLFVDPMRNWEKGAGQTPGSNRYDTMSTITDSGSNDGAAYGIVDNAPSYKETLSKYERGFALINNRTQFIVRDEIETIEPYEIYSYYHTKRGVQMELGADKKSIIMSTKDGQKCIVNFISDIPNFEIGIMDAVPHPNSPRPGPENIPHADNSGFHKIYFRADKVTKGHITAVFTPMMEDKEVTLPEIYDFTQWDKYLENKTALNSLAIDGVPLAEFSPGIGSYNFATEKVGEITATASSDVELEITQAKALGETAFIKATNKTSGKSFTYTVNFAKLVVPGITKGLEVASIEAPYIPEPQNPPENVLDGSLSTRFAADGTDGSAQFTIDLGAPTKLTGFSIAFYNGHTRKNKFAIEISSDKENWTKVFDGFSAGTTSSLSVFEIEPIEGRYVRFLGYGCYGTDEKSIVSAFNSITEFVAFGESSDFNDTKGHWAQSEIFFAKNYDLVNGVGDNKYMPENSVTRAEFITMMVRACAFGEVPYEDGTFADVKASDWYSVYVQSAKDKGIIPPEMTENGNFRPNEKLTREEMCAITVLAYTASTYRNAVAAGTTSIFKDVKDGPYASYIDKAIGLRVVNGMGDGNFAPKANITRAQAAAILRRIFLKVYNVNL